MALLGDRFPDWTEQDFYEIEIATTAIVFGFLMEREKVIAQVLDLDLNDCAEKIMVWVLEKVWVKSADYLQNGG